MENIQISQPVEEEDFISPTDIFQLDSEEHIKKREEKLKFRNLMLDSVKQKIELHRLANMQKLSKFQFDKVKRPSDRTGDEKISWIHRTLLWLETILTVKRVVIGTILAVGLAHLSFPFMKYVVLTCDKFYFGYFVEKVPPLAITTKL